ncbi:MAG: hypothetical protein LBJ61_11125, partial [Deltaproteobacteria bacterium]|nr:hypothetical protein [Deltaproteobacteria bacterium]
MKTINTVEAVGTVLCHDLTRIIKDEVKETVFRKGHVVKEEDIPVLLSIGKTHLFVWDLGENMVHENDAVTALYEACGMEGPFEATVAKEGGLHLTAGGDGLFLVDLALLAEFNEDGEMALVVRQSGVRVKKGDRVASFKVVPLAVERQKLDRVRALLAGKTVLAIKPYLPLKAAIIA